MTSCECCPGRATPHRRVRDYTYLRCRSCGYTFLSGSRTAEQLKFYGDAYFTDGGAGYNDYSSEQPLLGERGTWYAERLAAHRPPGRLLDVGCAAGYVMQGFAARGWLCTGTEPNRRMAEIARGHGFDVSAGGLESLETGEKFDVVSMIQVAAHFYDIAAALTAANRVTSLNGFWLFETWNAASVTARILGGGWHEYSPPCVLRVFTPRRPKKSILGAHAKSLLTGKARDSALMTAAAAMTRWIPAAAQVPYPAEDLFWRLYRRA